ncbi:isochorismate synthase MenF [Curtobacterium sp. B8]|uniref:isochorismate synthase n=1 Tax=Curtobacterium sp. B8 TaxID=95611 RepID=UPI0003B4AA90|nr:isochorismate synthase [Curtobacterium sp. B8]
MARVVVSWSSPRRRFELSAPAEIHDLEAARSQLRQGMLLCALLPFDGAERISAAVGFPRSVSSVVDPAEQRAPAEVRHLGSSTGRGAFQAAIHEAISRIEDGSIEKVVLARHVDLTSSEPWAVRDVLARLRSRGRTARFSYSQGNHTIIGASPELLVSHDGTEICSVPLAGSRARPPRPADRSNTINALERSAKDNHEHQVVVDAVHETLRPLGPVRQRRGVVQTTDSLHLMTELRVRPVAPVRSLDIARRLHPTPAICGTPRSAAKDLLRELEDRDRGYFSGVVGWEAADGTGEWWLVIRSAELAGRSATASAGVGIVRGSDPAAELAETDHKLRPMLRALGVSDIPSLDRRTEEP